MDDFFSAMRFLHIQHEAAARLRHIAVVKRSVWRCENMKRLAEREKGVDVALVGRVFPSRDVFKLEKFEPTGLTYSGNTV